MLALVHDYRTINIATNILIIFAGLYTYQGLIGRPGGPLRQLCKVRSRIQHKFRFRFRPAAGSGKPG